MSSSITIPPPLRNWLKAQYPTLVPKDTWLQHTISSYHGPRSAADGKLIEYIHQALLDTDLKDVAERAVLAGLAELKTGKEGVLGAGARGAVLLQVVGKLDIGVSAQTQLDVLEARRAARSTLTGSTLLLEDSTIGNGAGSSAQRSAQALQDADQPDSEHGDHMTEFNAAEEAATLPATVFPRSMLQLQLSDGFTTTVAFEHRRVPALSMADTPLGAKLLLKEVRFKRGRLFLEPRGVVVKGGQVAALELDAEEKLIDHLREKLGKPPLERKGGRGAGRTQSAAPGTTTRPTGTSAASQVATSTSTGAAADPSHRQHPDPPKQQQGPPSSFDEAQFDEDEAMWAELQEEEAMRRAGNRAGAGAPLPPATTGAQVTGRASSTARPTSSRPVPTADLSPSSSPPSRTPVRKKFKPLQPTSSEDEDDGAAVAEKKSRRAVGTGASAAAAGYDDGYDEDAVGASFFAPGMSDEDEYEDGEGVDKGGFTILERNDQGNPIVLSDSD